MTTHHPDEEILLDYASGNSREPLALLVATHLALCPACRIRVSDMEEVGGALLEDVEPTALSSDCYERTLARLERETREPEGLKRADARKTRAAVGTEKSALVPRPLRDYLPGSVDSLKWKRLSGSVAEVPLLENFEGYETRLMRIKAGSRLPSHTHEGREYTLVLAGGFTDQLGHYLRGDLSVADSETTHQPVADADEDCLCLAVIDAPLRFTGAMGRIINLFNRF